MTRVVKLAGFVLVVIAACSAQDGLSVRNSRNQKWPAANAQQIYLSACSVVQREFGRSLPLAPQVTLVLGADKDEVWVNGREIRLTRWDRDAFAQGMVWLAFADLMPSEQRFTITKRAVSWADSTVGVEYLKK